VQKVVGEVFLDDVALVATADYEIMHAMRGVDLHDVPENRLTTDLYHRLGLEVGFLGNASAETTGKDDGLHFNSHLLENIDMQSSKRLSIPIHTINK